MLLKGTLTPVPVLKGTAKVLCLLEEIMIK